MSSFAFKEFTIVQNNAALKVGGDAMILGAILDSNHSKKCLDIGAGTGVLSLMIAQRNSLVQIEAIEIDKGSIVDLKINFNSSKWNNRLSIIENDFLLHNFEYKFDLIVSNPPFYETKNLNSKENVARAKHNSSLPFEKLFNKAEKLLEEEGKFYIILPYENAQKWIDFANTIRLFCIEHISILAKKNRPKRSILCFSKEKKTLKEDVLIIRNEDNTYTEDYKKLTIDFHSKTL